MIQRWSKTFQFTLREAPTDAEIPSHQLMARAGLIRKVAPGLYTYGHFALRSIRKFEAILREELDSRGCQEILMPMVQPAEIWQETNRWTEMGEGLLKFKNRNGHDFCLGATHEEVVTDYVRKDVRSYRDLPVTLYQIQGKYRDEIRPRFGLMRGREFIMKDAYSFDIDEASALKSYELMYQAYRAIFDRVGVQYRIVQADAGNIGGSQTHEFQLLADAGEDHLMVCDRQACEFAANIEVASCVAGPQAAEAVSTSPKLESFATPGLKTIAKLAQSLGVGESVLVKTLFFSISEDPKAMKPVAVLVRGDDELNPVKLKNHLGLANPPLLLTDEEVKKVSGAWPGSCGPVGLTIPVYVDNRVAEMSDFVVGANRDAEHLRHVFTGRDFTATSVADLRLAKVGDTCPHCREGKLQSYRGIEVGHVFYLGKKYSEKMAATFLTSDGESKPIEMGCYGIGVSRTIQAAIEQSHDADGIVWPLAIAPYDVHIVVLDPDKVEVAQAVEIVARELSARGHDVFIDDRAERPGVKFKDADLLGFPIRLNIGGRGLQNGEVEMVVRKSKQMTKVKIEEAVTTVDQSLAQMRTANSGARSAS